MAKLIVEKSEREGAERSEMKDQAAKIAENAETIIEQRKAMQALTKQEKDLVERKTKLDAGELLLQQKNNEMKKREEILKNIEEAQREGTSLQKVYEDRDKELREDWRKRRKTLDESKGGEYNKHWKAHYDKEYEEEVAAVNEEKKSLWQREDKIAADTNELSKKAEALEAEKAKFEALRANWKAEKTALEVRIGVLQGENERMSLKPAPLPEIVSYEDDGQVTRLEAEINVLRGQTSAKDKTLQVKDEEIAKLKADLRKNGEDLARIRSERDKEPVLI
jgi:hypothetical protein